MIYRLEPRSTIPRLKSSLTLTLLKWTKWWAPTSASKWRMGFNSAFKGLICYTKLYILSVMNKVIPILPLLYLFIMETSSFPVMSYSSRLAWRSREVGFPAYLKLQLHPPAALMSSSIRYCLLHVNFFSKWTWSLSELRFLLLLIALHFLTLSPTLLSQCYTGWNLNITPLIYITSLKPFS
jgi:hypothetical protein